MQRETITLWTLIVIVLAGALAFAQNVPVTKENVTVAPPGYSPYAARNFPTQVFWGDTHRHTSFSPDAGLVGNYNLGPDAANRFASGKEVVSNSGQRVKLIRPLDFLVASDHSGVPL